MMTVNVSSIIPYSIDMAPNSNLTQICTLTSEERDYSSHLIVGGVNSCWGFSGVCFKVVGFLGLVGGLGVGFVRVLYFLAAKFQGSAYQGSL